MKNGLKLSVAVTAIALFVAGNAGLANANPLINFLNTAQDHAEKLQALIDSSVADSGAGITPSEKLIIVARDKTDANVAHTLIVKGADVNTRDANGATPLALAARNGHNAIIKVLIENGATLNAQDMGGYTPLMWATKKGNGKSAKLLLESGANPNIQNGHGQTALMLSADRNRNYIAKALLNKGADLLIEDASGDTAHSYASNRHHPSGFMIRLVSAN